MSVNISTMAAIVAAGAGAKVVKHGNRSASSPVGLGRRARGLGIRLDLPPDRVAEVAEEAGITFCFAAAFHPALRHAAVAASELGDRHDLQLPRPAHQPGPARRAQAIGCADPRMAPVMAGVLAAARCRRLGLPRRRRPRRAHHDHDLGGVGRSTTARSRAPRSTRARSACRWRRPTRCAAATPSTTPTSYAACWTGRPGPVRDAVLLNAGAAWPSTTRPARDVDDALAAGIARAAEAIDSGAAQATLDRWVAAASARPRPARLRSRRGRARSWRPSGRKPIRS